MKLALIANYPADAVVPSSLVKPRYRVKEHPSSWVRGSCAVLARMHGVETQLFVLSRAVTIRHDGEVAGVPATFIPRRLPLRSAPYHAYVPDRTALRQAIRAFAPDLVQGFGTEFGNGYLATCMGAPGIVYVQGIVAHLMPYLPGSRLRWVIQAAFERRAVRRASGVIAESAFAGNWVRSLAPGVPVCHLPNAINGEFFDLAATLSQPHVLSIGNVEPWKDPRTVLMAFAYANVPCARLRMIGDGSLVQQCRDLAAQLGITGQVDFLGVVSREQLLAEMRTARVTVIGSRTDTSPNVVQEAHAAGLPVIGTRAGGIPELIRDGEDGFLVKVADRVAMGERIRELLTDQDRARHMGASGRGKARDRNTPAAIGAQLKPFYASVLARTTSPSNAKER